MTGDCVKYNDTPHVPSAAIMCEVCVIIVIVEEGELKIDCRSQISERKTNKQQQQKLYSLCYTLYVVNPCSSLFKTKHNISGYHDG